MTVASCVLAASFIILSSSKVVYAQTQQQFLSQSFFFNFNKATEPVPIPTTVQCETLHLTWGRGAATGPSPVAPYSLQIYTSTFIVPFTIDAGSGLSFDWAVPFFPGTQYQICMFDKNGNTGGCEAVYTVIEPSSTPSCSNITYPGVLDVEGFSHDGPLSQFGWTDSCTDIQVTPKNGTPPYTFTAAPALHPPWNITVDSQEAVNWTVALSWASPFFISLADSAGNWWSYGPLHSGGNGKTACLNIDGTSNSTVSRTVTIATAVGTLVAGLLAGILASYLFQRSRQRKFGKPEYMGVRKTTSYSSDDFRPSQNLGVASLRHEESYSSTRTTNSDTLLLNRTGSRPNYVVEPFLLPPQDLEFGGVDTAGASGSNNSRQSRSPSIPQNDDQSRNLAPSVSRQSLSREPNSPSQHVYVVHHDGGRAPVTVYTEDGAEVHELPPRYIEGSAPTAGGPRRKAVRTSGAAPTRNTPFVVNANEAPSDHSRTATSNSHSNPSSDEPAFLTQSRQPGPNRKP